MYIRQRDEEKGKLLQKIRELSYFDFMDKLWKADIPPSCYGSSALKGMIRSAFSSLFMNWKNICRRFPLRICVLTLPWRTTPLTAS